MRRLQDFTVLKQVIWRPMTEKPILQPPSGPRSFNKSDAFPNKKFIYSGIIILAIIALVVVFILPGRFSDKNKSSKTDKELMEANGPHATQAHSSGAEVLSETMMEVKISEAKRLLKNALKLMAELESQDARTWGAYKVVTSYGEAVESISQGNSYLDNQQFDDAIKLYNQSIEQLEQLAAGRDQRLEQSLLDGQKAVSQFDGNTAARHFTIALAIDPGNKEAINGMERTKVMGRVIELREKAKKAEASGNLDLARDSYRNAISMDSGYVSLHMELRRLNQLILDRDFKAAMSDAITALDRKDYSKAGLSINRAKKIRPNDPGVKDLELQLERSSLSKEIRNLKDKAIDYEKKEKWKNALDAYSKILDLDENAGFAQKGKAKARELITLYSQIENYISNPGELQPSANMAHARNLYELAVSRKDAGPGLRAMTKRLDELIESYSNPVPVMLQSDNMTEVMIYKVGRFEKFNEKRIELKPGQYKALGTRSGYRDVTVMFAVPPDSRELTTVSIICEEKI